MAPIEQPWRVWAVIPTLVSSLAALTAPAHAQWSPGDQYGVPAENYPGRGVTARGDTSINVTTGQLAQTALAQTGTNPVLKYSATENHIIAFELSTWHIRNIASEEACQGPVKLRIPITPFVPTAPIWLKLTWYESTADGVIDTSDIATYFANRTKEVPLFLPAGVQTPSVLVFDVREPYGTRQLLSPERKFIGFFLERFETAVDSQQITILNGGARIEPDSGECPSRRPSPSTAFCYKRFGDVNQRWALVEFLDSVFDHDLQAFRVGSDILELGADGYPIGCAIDEYPAPTAETNFYPFNGVDGLAAYEIDLAGVSVPVSATNRVRVTVGFQAFDFERERQQRIKLLHLVGGAQVDVTDEYFSNRAGISDGGWIGSVPQSSASPFILAFDTPPDERCASVTADGFAQPFGADRHLGSTVPLRLALALQSTRLDSSPALIEAGLESPLVNVYDVTTGSASLIEDGLLMRDSGLKWAHELQLLPGRYVGGHTYEVRVDLGECELVPPRARFAIR